MTSLAFDVIVRFRGKTLATAESCTGGGIGEALTAVPGASDVFKGGIVSYCNEIKEKLGDRKNIILMGDCLGDVKMAREEVRTEALKIGFLEENIEESKPYFEAEFDVVCTNNTGFDELSKELEILNK